MDQQLNQLIQTVIHYSCQIKENERVVIEYLGLEAMPLVKGLIKRLHEKGVKVELIQRIEELEADFINKSDQDAIHNWMQRDLNLIKGADVYIMIKSPDGKDALSRVAADKMSLYQTYYYEPFYNVVLSNMRWLSMRFPSSGLAKNAGMSLEEFKEVYYNLCETDYEALKEGMDALVALMENTKKVHILGEGTDLTFELGDIAVHKCDGKINLPDGEIYTAPVRRSLNGKVTFNVASYYQSQLHEEIELTFKDGKVIKSNAKDNKKLDDLLDSDEGARYVGEFALGVNPHIQQALRDTLFDEKISGSFHLALGNCYENASNGNQSGIHWDLVCIQSQAYGGGRIYFDDVLIRENGFFLSDVLQVLNPK